MVVVSEAAVGVVGTGGPGVVAVGLGVLGLGLVVGSGGPGVLERDKDSQNNAN